MAFGQSAFTVVARVAPGKDESLREVLRQIGLDPATNEILPLGSIDTLHFASFVMFELDVTFWLTFEGNIDGSVDRYFTSLASSSAAGLDAIYTNCEEFTPPERAEYLKRHDQGFNTFFVGAPGRTRKQ